LEQLSIEFEYFKRVREETSKLKSYDGVKAVLEDTFEELIQYLKDVLRIFYKPDGSE
jgi:hypothetical protein